MTGALVLAVIVGAGEARTPVTEAIGRATSEALGSVASLIFVETSGGDGDAEALRIEESAAAGAAARVLWRDRARTEAMLRVHVARTDRWIERTLFFAAADSPIERGRTVGFAIASMLPEADPTLPIFVPAPAPPETGAGARAPETPPRRRFAGATFLAGSDVGGVARGLGGGLELGLPASDHLAARLGVGARGGAIASVPASGVTASVGAGVAWSPWPRAGRGWDLALRLDALLIVQSAVHDRAAGESSWKTTALPGGDALLELDFTLGGNLRVAAAAGAEVAFGTVDVTVVTSSGNKNARVPPARGVGQVALRLGF